LEAEDEILHIIFRGEILHSVRAFLRIVKGNENTVTKGKEWNKFWRHADVGVTPTRRNLFKKFKEIELPENAKILDVGCGSGTLAKFWKDQGYDVIGLDISDEALEITRNKGIYCIKGDVTKGLPFNNDTFDLVYSDGLLEHFADPKPILEEIFRVSKKYVLTIVPRKTITNLVHNIIVRPPKEYKREDDDWIKMHEEFSSKIKYEKVGFGKLPLPPHLLYILCEK
jgi:ubiquinone/menaquinone biosynthesis C-methylase UbiE